MAQAASLARAPGNPEIKSAADHRDRDDIKQDPDDFERTSPRKTDIVLSDEAHHFFESRMRDPRTRHRSIASDRNELVLNIAVLITFSISSDRSSCVRFTTPVDNAFNLDSF
jgi:hypothetical protein